MILNKTTGQLSYIWQNPVMRMVMNLARELHQLNAGSISADLINGSTGMTWPERLDGDYFRVRNNCFGRWKHPPRNGRWLWTSTFQPDRFPEKHAVQRPRISDLAPKAVDRLQRSRVERPSGLKLE